MCPVVQLVWGDLQSQDLEGVRELARQCLLVDGGLPTLSSEDTIHRLFASGPARAGRDETGEIVAVAALFRDASGQRHATGLVHPSLRGQGIGEDLVLWARTVAQGESVRVVIENANPSVDDVLGPAGLARVHTELVLRHDLSAVPVIRRPAGIHTVPYDSTTATLFYDAWLASFRDQPGYHRVAEGEWFSDLAGLPDFLPAECRVALTEVGTAAGFVTVSADWIDQVGVVPDWRGRGLGAHLLARSLTALKRTGSAQAWLTVTEGNPAVALYERLGFEVVGSRARYAAPPVP